MHKHRVLYITAVGEKGGMEVNLVNEIRHLDRGRFTPIVACLAEGPLVDELEEAGASVNVLRRGRVRHLPRTLLTILRLARLTHTEKVDLLVSENALAHIYGGLAAKLVCKPCLLRVGGAGRPPDAVERLAYRIGARCVIANSEYTKSGLVVAGVPLESIVVVQRGVNVQQFRLNRNGDSTRAAFGLPSHAPLITMTGRFQRGKGHHIFLEAAKIVVAKYPAARFLIVGETLFGLEPDYSKELHALAQRLGLNDQVVFAGFRQDTPEILCASDIVAVPSVTPEGFGMATLEGMAAGKPVIATGVGATPELIEQGKTGLLVPLNDSEALAEAILQLLASEALRRDLGKRAREKVERLFSVKRAVQGYERIYLACLEECEAAVSPG